MKTPTKLLCALALFTAARLSAQSVPEYVNYQGVLKAADGSLLPTGNYTMEFNIYNSANGTHATNRVWGPFHFDGGVGNGHGLAVPVVNGGFNVIIGPKDTGDASITNAFSAPNRFIEIKVNNGAPILPRQQFLSTAYAVQSQKAQLADVASMLVKDLYDALCPPGTIVAFGGTNIPSGWLLCDGRSLTNTMFPRLYAAISTNWGNGTQDSNDILENPDNPSTGFNLPDLRSMFLRGVQGTLTSSYWIDPGGAANRWGRKAGNAGNNVGSFQPSQMAVHNHVWGQTGTGNEYQRRLQSWTSPSATAPSDIMHPFVAGIAAADDWTTAQTDDDCFQVMTASQYLYTAPNSTIPASGETRPNNAYVNYIIKY